MKEEKNEEILKVKISFNKSEIDNVALPSSYDSFIKEIKKIYDLNLNSNISLTYKDEDQDSVNINSKENYSTFIEQITNNEVEAKVYIKVKEEQNMKRTNAIKNWLIFVGCKIPLIIYCEPNFEKNYHLKLCKDYTLIKFVNDIKELEIIMNKKDFGNFIIDNKVALTIKSRKKNMLKY